MNRFLVSALAAGAVFLGTPAFACWTPCCIRVTASNGGKLYGNQPSDSHLSRDANISGSPYGSSSSYSYVNGYPACTGGNCYTAFAVTYQSNCTGAKHIVVTAGGRVCYQSTKGTAEAYICRNLCGGYLVTGPNSLTCLCVHTPGYNTITSCGYSSVIISCAPPCTTGYLPCGRGHVNWKAPLCGPSKKLCFTTCAYTTAAISYGGTACSDAGAVVSFGNIVP